MTNGSRDRRVTVHHFDVFARAPGGGNPCPIVMAAQDLSGLQMQAIAAHYGRESAFAVRDDDGGLRLRYFVPQHEMAMCVHATVAAITGLLSSGILKGRTCTVRTASGECHVTWSDDEPPRVTVEQQPPQIGAAVQAPLEVEQAAGVPVGAIDDRQPMRSVSVSRAKLIVPIRHAQDVHEARPHFTALWDLCRRHGTTGAYLFAPHPDGRVDHVVARQFPVDAGYPEDPATGVAAGALAVHLADQARPVLPGWLDVDIEQGDAMGRPSQLHASAFADADGVYRSTVTGRAGFRHREDLDLEAVLDQYCEVSSELR